MAAAGFELLTSTEVTMLGAHGMDSESGLPGLALQDITQLSQKCNGYSLPAAKLPSANTRATNMVTSVEVSKSKPAAATCFFPF